jgi:hypothetical protein
VKHGIPFDRAMAMDEAELAAWRIMFGELEGEKWNWRLMRWEG